MSIRIHQLSKKLGMENKDLVSLLQERGFSVTSASSSIDNISAESLLDEFAATKEPTSETAPEATEAAAKPAEPKPPPGPSMPEGMFVKSVEQIKEERREKEVARGKPAASAPVVPHRPASAAPPPPPPRVSGPASPPVRPPPPVAASPASPKPMGAPPAAAAAAAGGAPGAEGETNVIQIKPPIVVRDFAVMLGLKPFKLISELMEMNIFAALNQSIDENVASQIAVKHGFLLDIKHRGEAQQPKEKEKEKKKAAEEADSKFLEARPPVVCIMGHVDHGKTSLLDKIRTTNVVAGESGGITQHIGAYQVSLHDRKITFLDTPGHSAFNQMRERGAKVTDIAILVVAADDGFMPQTDEALKYIRAAGVTPIVAINKIDTKGANIDRVKTQLQERDLMPEDWGGQTITCPVSALKGEGIDHLLEMILLQADVLELKANPKAAARGVVIEAAIEVGRGPTATVLVENGTLKAGAAVVCGPFNAKVRAMFDDQGQSVKAAPPGSAVRVIGWSGTPECGGIVREVKNDREAKRLAEEAEFESRRQSAAAPSEKPVSVENIFEVIAAQKKKTLRVVVKADVFGSVEAVVSALEGIRSDKVALEVVASDVGQISKNDVLIASAAKASIVGFNVRHENGVNAVAKHHGVQVHEFEIIYELVDGVRDLMAELLDPETREIKLGVAEVRAVFPVTRGAVAGCLVTEGRIQVNANARLRRAGNVEFEGKLYSLRRVKDEVKEVRAGTECGIRLEDFESYQPGDYIECFEVQNLRPTL